MRARLAFLLACAACSSFGAEHDTPDGGMSGDGGMSVDSGPSDGGGAVSTDAGVPCAAGAFCDDFERLDPQGKWDSLSTYGDTVTLPVELNTPSGQQFVRFLVSPKLAVPDATVHGRLNHGFVLGATNTIDMTFHFRAPKFPDSVHANLVTISVKGTPAFFLVIYATKDQVAVATSSDNANYPPPIGTKSRQVGVWDTVHTLIDLNAKKLSVTLESGEIVGSYSIPIDAPEGHAGVDLGPTYSDIQSAYALDFDAFELRTP